MTQDNMTRFGTITMLIVIALISGNPVDTTNTAVNSNGGQKSSTTRFESGVPQLRDGGHSSKIQGQDEKARFEDCESDGKDPTKCRVFYLTTNDQPENGNMIDFRNNNNEASVGGKFRVEGDASYEETAPQADKRRLRFIKRRLRFIKKDDGSDGSVLESSSQEKRRLRFIKKDSKSNGDHFNNKSVDKRRLRFVKRRLRFIKRNQDGDNDVTDDDENNMYYYPKEDYTVPFPAYSAAYSPLDLEDYGSEQGGTSRNIEGIWNPSGDASLVSVNDKNNAHIIKRRAVPTSYYDLDSFKFNPSHVDFNPLVNKRTELMSINLKGKIFADMYRRLENEAIQRKGEAMALLLRAGKR